VKKLRWRSVIGGIAAVVLLTGGTLFIIVYARAGALHGSRFRLFAAAPDASNLRRGSEVWLDGQRVGTVRAIAFNQPSAPIPVRIVIAMDVLSDVRGRIRLDSRAELRSGGSVIGEPVVYIESGTSQMRHVVPGDTLRAAGNPDLEIAASKVATSMEQLPVLIADSKTIIANAKTAGTRMSAILAGGPGSGSRGASSLSNNASAVMAKLTGGRGSASRLMRATELRTRVSRSMASMDSIRQLLGSRSGELGRFRRDSSLAPAVRQLQLDVARLREMAATPDGAIGRVRADSALRRSLDSVYVELAALLADMKSHPGKYAKVF
jgi:hypothetical protein